MSSKKKAVDEKPSNVLPFPPIRIFGPEFEAAADLVQDENAHLDVYGMPGGYVFRNDDGVACAYLISIDGRCPQ